MKVLVSGFEKFGGHTENSSEVILKQLKESDDLKTVLLPVSFKSSYTVLSQKIELFKPNVVICLGLAAKREKISLEKLAINLIDCEIADNDGVIYHDEPVAHNGSAAYFSNLPLKEMLKVSKAFPTEISYTAGTYVCNFLIYQLLHHHRNSVKAGFIHLPPLKDRKQDVLNSITNMIDFLK